MRIQGKHVVAGVLLLLSAGLAFDSISNYINPYLSVTQVALNLERYSGKSIQVMGIVKSGSFIRGDGGTIQFTLTDGQESLPVQFTGATPQNFDEGKDVVAVGSLTGEASLEAAQLLVKCPSKYEAVALAIIAVAYLAVTTFWKRG
jgi:cytochrome c-type biogenesis protein CcmE